jgi:ribokinase
MGKIIVVGSIAMDIIAEVDEFPQEGQTIIGRSLKTLPGGKGSNQAVAAARLGAEVEMAGMVGMDAYGETYKRIFKEEGIEARHVLTHDTEPTAVGLIQTNRHGENKIVVIPGANYGYKTDELEAIKPILKASSLVVTQLEQRYEVVCRLIELCDTLGVPLMLNPAPAVPMEASLLCKVAYVTPNETELAILSGLPVNTLKEVEAAIQKLLKMGVSHVVATLGAKGAMIGTREGIVHVPGFSVKVVDTVAAGDAFNGALAYGLVEGWNLVDAVVFANGAGALAVTKSGALPSLPNREEVQALLKQNPLTII